MPFVDRTCQALLNSLFGKTSNFGTLSTVPDLYVALSSTTPTHVGGNVTEHTIGNFAYARVATAASDWNAATGANPSVLTNLNPITFPTATGDWLSGVDLTHFVFYDAATSGNAVGWGLLTEAKPVLNGDTASFAAGQLSSSLA